MIFILDTAAMKKKQKTKKKTFQAYVTILAWRYIIRYKCYQSIKELLIPTFFQDFDWVFFFFAIWITEFRVKEKRFYGPLEYLRG